MEEVELDPNLSNYFTAVEETDHDNHEVVSLYPNPSTELTYKGRIGIELGAIVLKSRVVCDMSTHTDFFGVQVDGELQSHTVAAMSLDRGGYPSIRAVRVV